MQTHECQVLYQNESDEIRFLPEGPYALGNQRFSWVAIQHGAEATVGSLNILNCGSGQNENFSLQGRPGFAFPTNNDDVFVVGLERHVQLVNIRSGEMTAISDELEQDVENTIINDGVLFSDGIVFGCKDLNFAEKKAGLYLYRYSDGKTIRLRSDQICSNGKFIIEQEGKVRLFDIDSPTRKVVVYDLDVEQAKLSEPETILDMNDLEGVPDGMVETPDGKSLIIAFYNPEDRDIGEARQYSLAGELEAVWKTPGSPRVTCPQLVEIDGAIKLVLTTAVEHMTDDLKAKCPHAGHLFVGPTNFTKLAPAPRFTIPD